MKKKILILLIIFLAIFICIKYNKLKLNDFEHKFYKNSSEYQIIKENTNSNYSGEGQKNIKNKDGYFTTFETISRKNLFRIQAKPKFILE